MARIGAHFHVDHPLNEAIACGADAAQFFLGDPQGWKGPVIPGGDPAAVRDAFAAAGVDIYIHAPYIINVATSNNRIRIPSRKILDQQLKAAASVGAKGLIVHGGHVTAGVAAEDGLENWRKAVEQVDRIKAITGRIDLVHCNNSRDEFGSGRDRHANIGTGTIDPALLLGVVRAAGAPVICETPDENGGLAADVRWLKQHLPAQS